MQQSPQKELWDDNDISGSSGTCLVQIISLFIIKIPSFGSEFQKYALSSLQQLLADHPPAPEGLDPDIGTASNIHKLDAYFNVFLHVKTNLPQVEQVCVGTVILILWE